MELMFTFAPAQTGESMLQSHKPGCWGSAGTFLRLSDAAD